MATRELRKHLRIQSESRAVLIFEDGSRVKCMVRDLSLGGAYVMQCEDYGSAEPLKSGESIQIWIFHPGRAHEGPTLDAVVVRAETDGPGVAIRFVLDDDADELVKHVAFEAQQQKIPRGALGVPVLQLPPRSVFARAREIAGPMVNIAIFLLVVGLFNVVKAFLDAVL
jgi:hypothetical protein